MRCELISLYLYDVGRSVDLGRLELLLAGKSGNRDGGLAKGRSDTPESLLLPTPLIIDLESREWESGTSPSVFRGVRFAAKVYGDGVVTIECRTQADVDLDQLHTLRFLELPDAGTGGLTIDAAAERHFEALMARIRKFVTQDQYRFDGSNREDYHVFCLLDPVSDPQGFLARHSDYLAPFLLGENPRISLHAGQIATTLKTPFSFTDEDVAIFDMDRAFLVAPNGDYEDLLLIIEHANYQLLELRALDKLLDRLLEDAERDARGGSLSRKIGNLQALRLDALFVLENLENSSRIIGDYYLEQIYDHLCGIFNTGGWKRNVERRLEILQSIYTLTKADKTDRTMVLLEFLVVVMIGIELVALIVPLVR